jgi:hypothetical protein
MFTSRVLEMTATGAQGNMLNIVASSLLRDRQRTNPDAPISAPKSVMTYAPANSIANTLLYIRQHSSRNEHIVSDTVSATGKYEL